MRTGNDRLTGRLCALGCETLFGLSYLFTRRVTQTQSGFALLGWRFLVALAAMGVLALTGCVRIRLRGRDVWPLLRVALLSPCLYFIGETVGISRTTASESGAFLACIPVASLAASAVVLKKRPTYLQAAGILLTLLGVLATVLAVGFASSLSVSGYAFLLLAVLAYALYSVYVERASGYSEAEITFVMLAAGALVFGTLSAVQAAVQGTMGELISLPFRDGAFGMAVLYQGIGCSVLAFLLSNAAIARIGVNRTASFIGVSTVVSIAAGAFLLGERFTPGQLVGAAMILAGVYIANAGTAANQN